MTPVKRGLTGLLHGQRLAGAHVPRGAAAPNQRLEQAVRSQAVLAVHAVAGRLAGGVELGHRGAAVLVDPHAAHKVVLRGRDGNGLLQDVATVLKTARADVSEVPGHHVALDGGKAQPLVLGAVLLHLLADGGGDNVARLQLVGKTLAGGIEQDRSLAAAALADQERATRLRREQARGVDLHVVQVLHRNAMLLRDVAGITGELRVVGRVVVHATDTARCPQRMAGMDLKRLTGMRALGGSCQLVGGTSRIVLVHGDGDNAGAHRGAITLARQDVGHGHVLKNLHVVQLADSLEQLGRNLLARNVGMEGDARAAVRALAGKVEAAVGLALKVHAHGQQVVDDRTARANHDVNALAAVLVMAGVHGVLKEGIVVRTLGQHADAALREHRIALIDGALGEHDYARARRQIESRIQARHAAAGNDDVTLHIGVLFGFHRNPLPCNVA